MEGKVKITVIATGFDRPDAQLTAPASKTPVDLEHYTQWRRDEAFERPAHRGGGGGRPRDPRSTGAATSTCRRPGCVRPPSEARTADGAVAPEGDAHPLDVPAFMRRQDG
jgi:hypothetical protein